MFPIELALREHPVKDVCQAYGISKREWDELRVNPLFLMALQGANEALKKEGMTFKIKARLQAEALLQTSWSLIHAPAEEVPSSVKADLIKFTIKAAGYDESQGQKAAANAASMVNALQINLYLD